MIYTDRWIDGTEWFHTLFKKEGKGRRVDVMLTTLWSVLISVAKQSSLSNNMYTVS